MLIKFLYLDLFQLTCFQSRDLSYSILSWLRFVRRLLMDLLKVGMYSYACVNQV